MVVPVYRPRIRHPLACCESDTTMAVQRREINKEVMDFVSMRYSGESGKRKGLRTFIIEQRMNNHALEAGYTRLNSYEMTSLFPCGIIVSYPDQGSSVVVQGNQSYNRGACIVYMGWFHVSGALISSLSQRAREKTIASLLVCPP
jgi:hypothetical protein